MLKRTVLSRSLMLAFGSVATLVVTDVMAQAAPPVQQLQRVEVTGSNLRRTDAETASPVQVISRQDIEKSGKATVADYLQTLTVDNAGSIPSGFGTGFATGSQGISLRGLGAGSTLVLMNGRRMAPYGLADDGQKVFTDLSTVPMEAIDRIEILKDGASAIYGSDAIAGVVNIILRKDFTGVVAKASYGTSRYHDGDQWKGSLTAGWGSLASDRYNIFANLEVSSSDAIFYRDRDREWIGNSDNRRYGYAIGGSFFTPAGNVGPGGVGTTSPVGNVRNPATGQYQSLPGCSQFPTLTPPDPNGGCLWDPSRLYRMMLPKQDSVNLFVRGTYAISSDFEAYAELGLANKKSVFATSPTGTSGSWGYPGGPVNASSGAGAIVLAASHPDNPFGVGGVRLRYAPLELGTRVSHTNNDFIRAVVGLKGTFSGWDFDTALLHSETKLTNDRDGFLRYSVLKAALGDPTSPYFPFRIGVNAGLNPPSLYAALSPTITAKAKSGTDIFDVKASRELMQLPGGPMAVAVGAEYRRESTELKPVTYTDTGDILGLGYSAYDGKRSLTAAYVELLAPIVKSLEASAAVRYDRYSGGLSSTTPKVGLKWTPVPQVAVRGTYAEGFRAPNPAESGRGGLAAFTTARDPIRCPGGTPAAGATAADCGAQISIITTPNPNLSPEKSKSYTVGLVFAPTDATSVSVDVWKIKRSNEINQMTVGQAVAGGGTVVRADNNLAGIPNSGTLLAVSAPYQNSNSTMVTGLDLDARQRFSLGEAGKLTLSAVYTRLEKFERTEPNGTVLNFAGTHGNCDTTNCIGTPKDRINFGVTWERGPWQVNTLVNYIGSIRNVDDADQVGCNNKLADGTDAPAGCKIASFTTVDLSLNWKPTKEIEVFGSIQNLFDRVAPLDPHTYGSVNFNPLHVSGAIGRFYTLGMKYKF